MFRRAYGAKRPSHPMKSEIKFRNYCNLLNNTDFKFNDTGALVAYGNAH